MEPDINWRLQGTKDCKADPHLTDASSCLGLAGSVSPVPLAKSKKVLHKKTTSASPEILDIATGLSTVTSTGWGCSLLEYSVAL